MKISQNIRELHEGGTSRPEAGGGSTAVTSELDDAAAGMAEKSAEFAANGNRVYLPLAD
ncbi:thiamine biosynthesis protein ThiC [Kitasatospora sp. MAP12-44]|uniref:thiamine biosynthesis protein ThiC n=1 Tax=unclassified Kitasatospora TaxID=2633591 RepID=UPI002475295F|nr:thiamine biosynthesis protein ThiC [Kitasatospora sp. MAP12-44]